MTSCTHRDHATREGRVVGRHDLHGGPWEPCTVEQARTDALPQSNGQCVPTELPTGHELMRSTLVALIADGLASRGNTNGIHIQAQDLLAEYLTARRIANEQWTRRHS